MASLATEVKVANLALTYLGADRIMTLTEDSENARKINAVFALVRDEVLRSHPWNFAKARREFALLATPPAYGYSNAFQIQGDIIRILESETNNEEFVIEGDQVVTNESTFKCKCIIRITDTTKWTTDFVGAFAARLAAELAYSITDSKTLAELMWKAYIDKIRQAKATVAQEGSQVELEADQWLDSRLAGTLIPRAGG